MKKFMMCLLVGLISTFTLSGCGSRSTVQSNAQEQNKENVAEESNHLVVAVTEEPEKGFNPAYKWPYAGDPLFQSMLFRYDANGEVVGDLATEYSCNEDHTIYTIKIRDDAKCSDGERLTAKDVAFSYKIIPETNTWVDYSFLDHVEAVDDTTVKVYLKKSNAEFIHIMAMTAIIPEHAYDENTYAECPIGSGPYVLKQWDKGEKMVIEANPYYYGEKPATDQITFLFVNSDTALALAQRGEVDIARVSVNLADKEIKGYTKKVVDTNDGMSIYMPSVPLGEREVEGTPVGSNVTSDVAIRKAICYAIDREGMVQSILNGYGEPFYALFEGTSFASEEGKYQDNDIEKAKALLEDAGWIDRDGDGIREKDGVKASFTLFSVPQDQTYSPRQGVCLAVQQRLREIGIEMNIDFKQFSEIKDQKLLWQQAYLQGNGSSNPLEIYTQFHSDMIMQGSYNPTMYSNPIVDEYINKALNASTKDEADKYFKLSQWDGKTGTNILGDCVWIPVLKVQHIYYIKDGVDMALENLRKAPHRGATWACTETIKSWKKDC